MSTPARSPRSPARDRPAAVFPTDRHRSSGRSRAAVVAVTFLLAVACGADEGAGDQSASIGDEGPTLTPFDSQDANAAGFEAIGCWFAEPGAQQSLFFAGYDGAYAVIDGVPTTLGASSEATDIDGGAVTDYTDERWALSLTDLGEPEPSSIESSIRSATLTVIEVGAAAGTTVVGELSCGV